MYKDSVGFVSWCSAKKDMDRQEFMFFLTGGVGLENKVRKLLYPIVGELPLLHSSLIPTHPGCLTDPGTRFAACVTCLPSRSFDSSLKRMSVRGRNCMMIASPTQLHSLSLGMNHSPTSKR